MKKFFSLICAIAIVFSASAAPVSKKDVLAGKVAKKEFSTKHAAKHEAKSAFKAFDNKNAAVAKAPAKKVVLKAPKAKKEVIDLTFAPETADIEWEDNCAAAGWWQIQAENDSAYVSVSNLDRDEAAGEYAWEDLDPEYTGFWLAGMEGVEPFVDGSCLVDVDVDGNVRFEGTFSDAEGNTYRIRISCPAQVIEPGDYDFVAVSESDNFYATDGDVYFTFRDAADNVIHFDILVAEGDSDIVLGQEYTLEDMIADYSNVTFDEVSSNFVSATFVKTIVDETEKYAAVATDEYGRIFHVSYEFTAPKAEKFDTIKADITMTSEPYWFWTMYTFKGQDEKNAIVLQLLPDDEIFGVWEAGKDITGAVVPVDGEESAIYSGEVVIEQGEEGSFTIKGAVLCFNNTKYTLDLTYVIPDPTREEVFMVEGLELTLYDGAWQLMGYNEDSTKFVSVAAYTDEITGNYTAADLAADYTYIVTDITEEGYNQFTMLKADLTVQFTEEDSTIIIAGNFLGQNEEDVPLFTVLLKGKIPAPEVSDLTFEFRADEEGITVIPSNDEDPWDWYIADEATVESYGGADGLAEAVYNYFGNAYAITGELFLAWDGEEIQYYCADGGKFYLVTWGSGERGVTTEAAAFEFEVEGGDTIPSGNEYDAEEDFVEEFAAYEIDDQYIAQGFNVVFVEAISEDNKRYVSLELWLPEGASTLVPGEYPISLEERVPQTAFAAELSDGRIYGSFAAFLIEEEGSLYIDVPLWFITTGKVIVAEDGTITVDALNTKGAAIQVVLRGEETIEPNTDCNITYIDGDENVLNEQVVRLALPEAPEIEGLRFIGWQVVASDSLISEVGIILQAVYEPVGEGIDSANAPSSFAEKLIRDGNVYILRDAKLFSIKGELVK